MSARFQRFPFSFDDRDAILALFRDPHVRAFLLDGEIVSEAFVDEEIAASRQRFAEGRTGLWLVRVGGAPAGFCGIRPFGAPGDTPGLGPPEGCPQLVYALEEAHTGHGLATAVAAEVLAELGPPIDAGVDAPNVASVRVLEKLGFRRTGEGPGVFGRIIRYTWTGGRR